jgi:hypothetical protein
MSKHREAIPAMTDEEYRFWSKVRIGDGCWEWRGSSDQNGVSNQHVSDIVRRKFWAQLNEEGSSV